MANKYQIIVEAKLNKVNLQKDLDTMMSQVNKKMASTTRGGGGIKVGLDQDYIQNQVKRWENTIDKMKARTPAAFSDSDAVKESMKQYQDLKGVFENTGKGAYAVGTAIGTVNKDVVEFQQSLRNVHHDGNTFFQEMAINFKKVMQWGLITGIVYGTLRSIKEGVQYIHELNEAMTNTEIVTGMNASSIQQLTYDYGVLAQEVGATTLEVAEGSLEWFRQGKTAQEALDLTRSSLVMAKLGNIEAAQSTEYLTSMLNGFKLEAEDANGVIDKLIALDNAYATSVAEIASALQRSSNSAQQAGVSFDELASYITVVSSVTRKSSESIGESFKTMFSRMQNIKLGKMFEDEATDINDVERALSLVDIKLRDSEDSFRDMGDVLVDISENWETMTEVEQSAVANAVAGTRQRENFLVLMNNFNEVLVAQAVEYNSAGLAAERYEIYLNSLEAATNRNTAAMERMWEATINEDALKFGINFKTAMFNAIASVGGLGVVLGGLGAILATMNWGGAVAALPKLAAGLKSVGVAAKALFAGLTVGTAIVAGIVVVLGALFFISGKLDRQLRKNADAISESNDAISTYRDGISGLNSVINRVDAVSGRFEELRDKTNRTNDEQREFLDLQNELKALLPDIAGFHDENGNFILAEGTNLEELNAQTRIEIEMMKEKLALAKQQKIVDTAKGYDLQQREYEKKTSMAQGREMEEQRFGYVALPGVKDSGTLRQEAEEAKNLSQQYMIDLAMAYNQSLALGEEFSIDFMEMVVNSSEDGKALLTEVMNYAEEVASNITTSSEKMEQARSPESLLAEMDALYQEAAAVRDLINNYDALNGVTLQQVAQLQAMFPLEYQQALMIDQQTGLISLNIQALQSLVAQKADATNAAAQHAASLNQESAALQGILSMAGGFAKQVRTPSFWAPPASSGGGGSGISQEQKNYNDLLKDTISMLKKKKELQKDALKEELDGYKKIIDARKQALDQQQEEDEYQDDLSKMNEELADIDNELLQLQFDNSEWAKARRLELEEERAERVEEINKFQADRSVEIQKDALDEDYENFKEIIDKKIGDIEEYLSKTGAIRAEAIELLRQRHQSFYNDLIQWNRQYGSGIDSDIRDRWNNATSSVNAYGAAVRAATEAIAEMNYGNYSMTDLISIGFYPQTHNFHNGGMVGNLPTYHDGGVIGASSGPLKSNEVLSKLLIGEVVATQAQAQNFLNNSLPMIVKAAGGTESIHIPININVNGITDKGIIPDIKEAANKAVLDALAQRGKNRTVSSFSI